MYHARRMTVKEFTSDEAFIAKDSQGAPRIFGVEHESGAFTPGMSWREAVAEAKELNEQLVTMLVPA